ncbi:MAG: hypothetical protein GTO18_13110 [Anaerolineales bacterium]|nr:hypothetical protein [Anaerolineales bacterium]
MLRHVRLGLIVALFINAVIAVPALAMDQDNCVEGTHREGALYLICMPTEREWNGDLVIFAHGYVAFNEPLQIPDLYLPDGTYLPDIANGLGYAFATTSYSENGLAVLEGIQDLRDLVDVFSGIHGSPNNIYLVGGSEGGIITTLAVEQYPEEFTGGLAACGPIGDFHKQVTYWGDFRAVFDVFFPDAIPGSPIEIPDEVIENWETVYASEIAATIQDNRILTAQLLNVTKAPIDIRDQDSIEETVLGLLWYNVFATNDGIAKLHGQPFGNMLRIYTGSLNDIRLNRRVIRVKAEVGALEEIERNYQTTGELVSPIVSLHTTKDPIIPYWHVLDYRQKVQESGSTSLYANVPVPRYGHCEFKTPEVLVAFALLVYKANGQQLEGVEGVLLDADDLSEFFRLAQEYGLNQ